MPLHQEPSFLDYKTETEIRALQGNDRCADCGAGSPMWADVSFGLVVCLLCSGRHRSLGVGVSVVRSLDMDDWSQEQIQRMMRGGNAQWHSYCRTCCLSAGRTTFVGLYTSADAQAYKSRLSSANSSANDCESLDDACDFLMAKCTLCNKKVHLEQLDSHSSSCQVKSDNLVDSSVQDKPIDVELEDGVGFTISKTCMGKAIISKISSKSFAAKAGIASGSLVLGVNGKLMDTYDDIMSALASSKPMRLTVGRIARAIGS